MNAEPASSPTLDQAFLDGFLRPAPGATRVPPFDRGWLTQDGRRRAFLDYLGGDEEAPVNWSESLEELHAGARAHFLDAWTRRAMLARLGPLEPPLMWLDIGCSTGHLLEDLERKAPRATLIGVDAIASGLDKAHAALPQALLLRADVCALPIGDASVDVVLSANVLEHVRADEQALAEMARILRPGARALIVVPLDPGSYNYFDRALGHERRYARGELARKAKRVGLETQEEICLGGPLYPAFWLGKRYYQRRYGHLEGEALQRRVAAEVEDFGKSTVGSIACRCEEALLNRGVKLPFGIRGLTVLARPRERRTPRPPAAAQQQETAVPTMPAAASPPASRAAR